MSQATDDLLWRMAESDEVDIETRDDPHSPPYRTTIWIVTTQDGVYVRSYKGRRGLWYLRALKNPRVRIRVGRRQVEARVVPESNATLLRKVSAAFEDKYGERWPAETEPMVKPSVVRTTLRVVAAAR